MAVTSPVSEIEIIQVLRDIGALKDEDGLNSKIKWTGPRLQKFRGHEKIAPILPTKCTEALENSETALEVLKVFNAQEQPALDPNRGNRTINPARFELFSVQIDNEAGHAKASARCDGNLIPDEFTTEELDWDVQNAFINAWSHLQVVVLRGIPAFKPHQGFELVSAKRDTRGKGDKKKDIYLFKISDPSGAIKNSICSGEMSPQVLPPGAIDAFNRLSDIMLDVYKRKRFYNEVEQLGLGDGESEEGEDGGDENLDD